jgi:hypothetical protein
MLADMAQCECRPAVVDPQGQVVRVVTAFADTTAWTSAAHAEREGPGQLATQRESAEIHVVSDQRLSLPPLSGHANQDGRRPRLWQTPRTPTAEHETLTWPFGGLLKIGLSTFTLREICSSAN